MINGVAIKKIEKFSDDRGWLAEIFRNDEIDFQPAMEYISQTKPEVVRGPHEHIKQSDYFIFLFGTFRVYLWDNRIGAANYRQLETIDVGQDNPCAILVPPGVVHAYKCISAEPGLVINMPDKLYRGQNKHEDVDEVRWESMSDSPFIVD